MISITCAISALTNDGKYKYIFMFPKNKLIMTYPDSAAKLAGPQFMTDENVGGPVENMIRPIKLLYVIMFEILKSCQKCIFGGYSMKSFQCLHTCLPIELSHSHTLGVDGNCLHVAFTGPVRLEIHNTVETLYNTINFCWSTHKRHSIARPKGRGMGCLLWIQRAKYCLDLSILSFKKYLL